MEEITGDDCFRVLDKPEYIFFYFTASWCGPCKKIPAIRRTDSKIKYR